MELWRSDGAGKETKKISHVWRNQRVIEKIEHRKCRTVRLQSWTEFIA